MSVTYESAMSTLTSMFGSVDREVVAMLLQANGGHMEKTVENLLALTAGGGGGGGAAGGAQGGGASGGGQAAAMRRPSQQAPQPQSSPPQQWQQQSPPYPHPQQPYPQPSWQSVPASYPGPSGPPPYASPAAYPPSHSPPYYPPPAQPHYPAYGAAHGGVPYQQQQQQQQSPYYGAPAPAPQSRPAAAALPVNGGASVPPPAGNGIILPDDFLRPPSYFQTQLGPQWAARHPSAAAAQIEQDALLAQMLQDQQFMQFVQQQQQQPAQPPQPQPQAQARPQPHQFPMQPQSAAAAAAAAPRMAAPPAHPHPDFEARSRGNSAVWTPPAAAAAVAASDSRASAASAAPAAFVHSPPSSGAAGSSGFGSEPLHPNLRASSVQGVGSSSVAVSEQQSSFAKRWNSLTASAREKLARLSEKFKKDPLHDRDLDGGGDYQSMLEPDERRGGAAPRPVELSDVRFAEDNDRIGAGGSHADFLSAEEAANLQASYHAHVPPRASASKANKKNPFTVDDGQAEQGEGGTAVSDRVALMKCAVRVEWTGATAAPLRIVGPHPPCLLPSSAGTHCARLSVCHV